MALIILDTCNGFLEIHSVTEEIDAETYITENLGYNLSSIDWMHTDDVRLNINGKIYDIEISQLGEYIELGQECKKLFSTEKTENKRLKNYVFLTFEGFTQTPKGDDIENIQMLGIGKGHSKGEAFQNFKDNNSWVFNTGFNEVYCHELRDDKFEYFYIKN